MNRGSECNGLVSPFGAAGIYSADLAGVKSYKSHPKRRQRPDDCCVTGRSTGLCVGDRDDSQAYSCDSVGSAEAGLGSLRFSTAFSKFLQGFAMHREFSTPAIYADSHWRESPYCRRVEIFTTRKVDVYLCSEHPKIRRFTQAAHTVNT